MMTKNEPNRMKRLIFLLTGALGCFCALTAPALTATVGVGNANTDTFTPAVTNITAGDTVSWVWNSSSILFHDSTSTNPALTWSSPTTNRTGYVFSFTFTNAGSYPYLCTVHTLQHMTGAVIVAAAPLPPTVAITNPANGAVFSALANIKLGASATASGGSVTNVRFLQGAAVLTNLTAAPYAYTVSNLAAASYTFSAVATDSGGLSATNSITNSVVTPVAVALTAPKKIPPASFQFSYSANTGLSYVVQRSTNLLSTNWLPLATNTAASNPVTYTDTTATVSPGFYRVGRLPNP